MKPYLGIGCLRGKVGGKKGERLHHRRRRPNSVMQRLAPSSSLKNSGATKCLYLLPSTRLDRGQEPLFLADRQTVGPDWMARTYTQVRPEELAGKLARRGGGRGPHLRRGGIRRRRPRQKFAHATRNISDRAATRVCNAEAGVGGGGGGGDSFTRRRSDQR